MSRVSSALFCSKVAEQRFENENRMSLKENYQGAMDVYYREVHTYDAYMDELERKSKSSDC